MGLRPTKVDEDAKWGGPPGPQPTPSSASWKCDRAPKSGSRGTRADQGSAPLGVFTNFSGAQAQGAPSRAPVNTLMAGYCRQIWSHLPRHKQPLNRFTKSYREHVVIEMRSRQG